MTVSLPASNFIGPSLTKIDIYVQKYDEPIRVVLKSTLSSDVSMSRNSLSFGGPNDSGDLEITAGPGVGLQFNSQYNLHACGKSFRCGGKCVTDNPNTPAICPKLELHEFGYLQPRLEGSCP